MDDDLPGYEISRRVFEANGITWTIESFSDVLTPGQVELTSTPAEDEWEVSSFKESLSTEAPQPAISVSWRHADGLISDLLIEPGVADNNDAPSNSHIEVRLTPLMAAVDNSEGQAGVQMTISVEITLGTVDDNREFRVNGHGDWQIIE